MNKTLKKSISILLSIILCFASFGVVSYAADTDPLLYTVQDDGTAVVVKCDTDAEGTVVVPSVKTIKGKSYDVVAIGKGAFENCVDVTAISISEGIKTIDSRAFANCTGLTDVYVPQSLTVCQYTAFSGCNIVTVHCYSSNYQFFTVYGLNQNLKIDIIDSEEEDSFLPGSDVGLTSTIVDLVKRIILMLLYFFLNSASNNA